MTIEYDEKINLRLNSWQIAIERNLPQPDQFTELKAICGDLFIEATQDMMGNPTMDIPITSIDDPNILNDTILRAIQSNRTQTPGGKILKKILSGSSPQEIIFELKDIRKIEDVDTWEIMRELAEFNLSHDTGVLQSILGYDMQHS